MFNWFESDEERDSVLEQRLSNGRTVREEIEQFDKFSDVLDTRFSIFGIKFGVDSLIGMFPILGDVFTALLGLYALVHAFRLELPTLAKLAIVRNVLVDMGLGAIPIVGDIFDFFFRSNRKNFEIVEKHLRKKAKKLAKESGR